MLAEADYSTTTMALGRNASQQADSALRVQFGTFPHLDQDQSDKEGRPIYTEEVYIMIMVPGERDIVHRPAWEKDFERFPQQYAAFKNKQSQDTASGTPLKVVPWLSLGQVKELEYFNCYTLEQLANMPDSTAQRFLQINKLKQLAKDHLQAAKESSHLTTLRADLDKKDSQIEMLMKQVSDLGSQLEQLVKAKK